jgi:exodeoxyribonuclease VII small subunit
MANAKKSNAFNFEKAMARLEKIVSEMEQTEPDLDKALALFEEGVGLVKECGKKLNDAKQKIEILTKNGGGFQLEEYES